MVDVPHVTPLDIDTNTANSIITNSSITMPPNTIPLEMENDISTNTIDHEIIPSNNNHSNTNNNSSILPSNNTNSHQNSNTNNNNSNKTNSSSRRSSRSDRRNNKKRKHRDNNHNNSNNNNNKKQRRSSSSLYNGMKNIKTIKTMKGNNIKSEGVGDESVKGGGNSGYRMVLEEPVNKSMLSCHQCKIELILYLFPYTKRRNREDYNRSVQNVQRF